ncbi:hypothetical protein HN51_070142 [Arachis hypogaea]
MDSLNSYYQGRYFYMEINPNLEMGEIPSTFYRRFKDALPNLMTFYDSAGNEVDLVIEKCHQTAIIVTGYNNLGAIYGLKDEGWLSVCYVGQDRFLIVEVKDHNMQTKELCYPPLKLSVDIKPSIPVPGIIELSDDETNATPPLENFEPVQVSHIGYQQPYAAMDNSKWDDATDQLQHLPESVLNLLTCIDPSTYYGLEPYFNQLEPSVNNEDQDDQLDPIRPIISLLPFPESPFLDVPQTKNISSVVAEETSDNCNISAEVVSNENAGFPNGQSPPPLNRNNGISPPRSPIMQDFYSVVRVISEYQSKHYSMLLLSAFSLLAFPSRPDFVALESYTSYQSS